MTDKPNRGQSIARITEALLQGKHLTARDVVKELQLAPNERTARQWLKAVRAALGDRVKIKHLGATKQFSYQGDHAVSDQQMEQALVGLQVAERVLDPFPQTQLVRSIREARAALSAQNHRARDQATWGKDLLLRPKRPMGPGDLAQRLNALIEAIHQEQQVQFEYLTNKGERSEYAFNPWALIDHADGLYLFGEKSDQPGERRNFDVANIENLKRQPRKFSRPPNVKQLFEDGRDGHLGIFNRGEPEPIELEVRNFAHRFLSRRPLTTQQQLEPFESGRWCKLSVHLVVERELLGRLLMLGGDLRVRSPARLAKMHHEQLLDVINSY